MQKPKFPISAAVAISLRDINPFDATHIEDASAEPGFRCIEDVPGAHLDGARHCRKLLARGAAIRPIAVCRSDLVPEALRDPNRPWQRLDGFKRYWGHRLAGHIAISCVVFDQYLPGTQHGMSMTADDDPAMKTDDLPLSQNIEDRRGEKPAKPGPASLADRLAAADADKNRAPRGQAEPMAPQPDSKLARDAGIEDIKPHG